MQTETFFSDKGLTSTSANYLANLAQEVACKYIDTLSYAKFYSVSIDIVGVNGVEKEIEKGCNDEYVKQIPSLIDKIGKLNAFCAWMREAIKAKDKLLNDIKDCLEYPEAPELPVSVSEKNIIDRMNVKERNEYLTLEANAAALGKYIHRDGSINTARRDLHEIITNPVKVSGSGRDTIIYTRNPSVDVDLVDTTFLNLQNLHRTYEQQLNSIKFKIKEQASKESADNLSLFRKQQEAYNSEVKRIDAENEIYKIKERERISKLKIVIPNELMATYEYLNSLGKGDNS